MFIDKSIFYKIAVIAVIKSALFFYFASNFQDNWPKSEIVNSIFIRTGDTSSYLTPIENMMDGNGYGRAAGAKENKTEFLPFAGRMPGFLPVYGPLYYFFGEKTAGFLLVIIQFLIGVLATYVLAWLSGNLFSSERIFWITLVGFSLSSFVSIFDHYGFAESLATSFLIFSCGFLYLNSKYFSAKMSILSGIFACWALFMRPALGINLILFPLFWFFLQIRKKEFTFLTWTKNCILFLLPFLICEMIWVIRNEKAIGAFIPLEASYEESYKEVYSPQQMAIQKLIIAWGGSMIKWDEKSDAHWFIYEQADDAGIHFSADQFTSSYSADSLYVLRQLFRASMDTNLVRMERNFLAEQTVSMTRRLYNSYKSEKPFRFYVTSKLILLKQFLFVGTVNHLPFPKYADMTALQKTIKSGYLLLYYLVLIGGITGIVLVLVQKKLHLSSMIVCIPVAQIFIHPVWFGYIEHRYFVPVYPFMLMFAAYALNYFSLLLKKEKKQNQSLKNILFFI